jgi:hypothetical protein
LEGTGLGSVTTSVGLFELSEVPPGDWVLRVQHIAYGELRERLTVESDTEVALRVVLSPTTIELEPIVVEGVSRRDYEDRARGTASNVVTREQIEESYGTSQNLAFVLQRNVTGAHIRADRSGLGMICLEFRAPRSLRDPTGCKSPTLFVDGVRIQNVRPLWSTFPIEDIERMEFVPSVEAGARYGTDSNYGVLLIETRTGAGLAGRDEADRMTTGTTYDWSLESESYPWFKVFASSFVGNALGLTLGYAAGSQCLNFGGLSDVVFNPSCGGLATAGATTVMVAAPMFGSSLAAGWAGQTDLSKGRVFSAAIAAAFALVPGYILVAAADDEAFAGAEAIGWVTLWRTDCSATSGVTLSGRWISFARPSPRRLATSGPGQGADPSPQRARPGRTREGHSRTLPSSAEQGRGRIGTPWGSDRLVLRSCSRGGSGALASRDFPHSRGAWALRAPSQDGLGTGR